MCAKAGITFSAVPGPELSLLRAVFCLFCNCTYVRTPGLGAFALPFPSPLSRRLALWAGCECSSKMHIAKKWHLELDTLPACCIIAAYQKTKAQQGRLGTGRGGAVRYSSTHTLCTTQITTVIMLRGALRERAVESQQNGWHLSRSPCVLRPAKFTWALSCLVAGVKT